MGGGISLPESRLSRLGISRRVEAKRLLNSLPGAPRSRPGSRGARWRMFGNLHDWPPLRGSIDEFEQSSRVSLPFGGNVQLRKSL